MKKILMFLGLIVGAVFIFAPLTGLIYLYFNISISTAELLYILFRVAGAWLILVSFVWYRKTSGDLKWQ